MTSTLTILVVDDTQAVREIIKVLLMTAGHKVIMLEDGRGVAKVLDNQLVDLILVDLLMPEMDGFALIKEIRPKWPSLPIILMSGGNFSGPNHYLDRAELFGVSAFLGKPFTRGKLFAVIDEAIALAANEQLAQQAV
jgi:DNA-binding NtrC family response regulator